MDLVSSSSNWGSNPERSKLSMSKSFNFLVLFLCVCWTTTTVAQDRYAVFFKCKPQKEYSLGSPSKFLTEKAIQRRVREKFPLDSLDLPVTASYIQGISSLSQELLYVSKWLNAAIVVTDAEGKKKNGRAALCAKSRLGS